MELKEIVLDNKISLFYIHILQINTVASGVLVKAGTRHEIWPKEAGIAHALEHMRFQGTQLFPTSRDISALIEDDGGVINAWTSGEGTFFWQKIPATAFAKSPLLLSQQLLHPLIPEKKIATEMQNIVQEIRMVKDDPSHFALREFGHLIYSGHVLSRDVLGTEESVTSFTRPDFMNFSDRLYFGQRMRFIVVGNVPELDVVRSFNSYFHDVKASDGSLEENTGNLKTEKREVIHKRQIEQVHMVVGYLLGAGDARSVTALSVFANMIGGGMSFPLFQTVRDKHGLCYQIDCSVDKNKDCSTFYIYVGTNPAKYRDAENLILQIIKECKNNRQLLERAKSLVLGRLSMSYENPASIMQVMAQQILYRGHPKTKVEMIREIESITIGEVEEAVSTYLSEIYQNTLIVGPESLA